VLDLNSEKISPPAHLPSFLEAQWQAKPLCQDARTIIVVVIDITSKQLKANHFELLLPRR